MTGYSCKYTFTVRVVARITWGIFEITLKIQLNSNAIQSEPYHGAALTV